MAVVFGHVIFHGVTNDQLYISLYCLERVVIVKACLASSDHFLEAHGLSNDILVVKQGFGDRRSEVAEIIKFYQDIDELGDIGPL